MKRFIICFFIFFSLFNYCSFSQNESTKSINEEILTPGKFNQYLLNNHPVIKKADLIKKSGEYEVGKARGNFDPKIFSDWNAKNFKSKSYYQVSETGIKIPTWYGIDLKLYYEANTGTFLNPENNVPSNGLYGAGLSLPLGEGLFTDKRRTALNKAKVVNDMKVNQRQDLLINLLFKSFNNYWEWVGLYSKQKMVERTSERAKQRFMNVKESYEGGEKPAIDTTDALSQWNKWKIKLTNINGKYQKKSLNLSSYLWNENQQPLKITPDIKPPEILSLPVSFYNKLKQRTLKTDSIPENHPALRKYKNKLRILKIENRWKKEQIKPTLDLKYHALQNAGNKVTDLQDKVRQDMKWGIAFKFPIFLRKERNSLKLNKLKMQSTQLDFIYKKQQLQNKLDGLKAKIDNLYMQIKQNNGNIKNYRQLVDAEETKFENGESTIFQINYREIAYLKASMNQIEFITSFFKTYSKIMYLYNMDQEAPAMNNEE